MDTARFTAGGDPAALRALEACWPGRNRSGAPSARAETVDPGCGGRGAELLVVDGHRPPDARPVVPSVVPSENPEVGDLPTCQLGEVVFWLG